MTPCFFILAKTETLCGRTQDILLLKGTTHHLSLYDKMPVVRRSFIPVLHFSLAVSLLQKVCKQDDK